MDKDIFVSYSRRNQDVCRKLVAALARTESDTWVDWEGIPLSSDWWGEIESGIENAETVLVLLSNDWLASPVCHLEMSYALSLNKRVVPVVYGDIDHDGAFETLAARDLDAAVVDMLAGRDIHTIARDNWRALSKINWAFYREEDFTEGASKLLAALQTDLAHARAHTRLLNRALEWGRGGRDASLLLRGVDLDQAVGWLAYNAGKEPFPTDLHRDYIHASQRQREAEEAAVREQQARELALQARALNRARMLIASLGVFLVVAGLLSVFALQQREEAVQQAVRADDNAATSQSNAILADNNAATAVAERDRADSEAKVAKARELAAQALGLRDNRSAQAMLLGVAAYQTAPVFETESALLTLTSYSNQLLTTLYQRYGQGIAQVVYSPSATLMAVVYYDGEDRLSVIDTATQDILYTLTGGAQLPNSAVYFSDDTTLLLSDLTGLHRLDINLMDNSVKTTMLVAYPSTDPSLYLSTFSRDGQRVAIAALDTTTGQHSLLAYDIQTAKELYRQALDFQVLAMQFNADGTRVVANRFRDAPVVFDVDAKTMTALATQNTLAQDIQQAYFYDDSTYLTLTNIPGNEGQFIAVYDPVSDLFSEPIYVPLTVNRLMLHPSRQYALALEAGGAFKMYQLSDGKEIFTSSYHENDVISVEFSQDNQALMVTGDSGGMLAMWDLEAKPDLQTIIEAETNPALAMSLAGERLAVFIETDSIRQYDITTWQEVAPRISVTDELWYLTVLHLSQDHRRLMALEPVLGHILVWDAQTGDLLTESLTGSKPVTAMAGSPDGRWVVAYNPDDGMSLWDVEKHSQAGEDFRFETPTLGDVTNNIINMVFNADGTQLAVISFSGSLWLYDVSMDGLTLQKQVVVDRALQIGVRFSPDGKLLALASNSNAILLYDIDAERLTIPPLSGAEAFIYNIVFRPDGRVIAVMDGYSQLWLWDTARGLPIGLPAQAHYIAYDAVFTPDGQHLISIGSDPVISEWDFSPDYASERLCQSVGRELTAQEWALYVGESEAYQSVCAG